MSSEVRVVCPGCNKELRLKKAASSVITCPTCGKKLRLKAPVEGMRTLTPSASAASVSSAIPVTNLADLQHVEFPTDFAWNQYSRRKRFIQAKPLWISVGIVGLLALVGVLGFILKNLSERIDMGAVSTALRGPDDSVNAIYSEWKRNVAEHQRLLASIQRRSDCTPLLRQFESLVNRQTELVARAALLETTHETLAAGLPPLPVEREPGGRTFRAIDALLTNELRELDEQLSAVSNALLRFFHAEATELPEPDGVNEKIISQRIAMKRLVIRWLASVVQGTDVNEASVAIYEVAEDAKKLRAEGSSARTVDTTPSAVGDAEKCVEKMRGALETYLVKSAEDPIAKSLAAFDAVW